MPADPTNPRDPRDLRANARTRPAGVPENDPTYAKPAPGSARKPGKRPLAKTAPLHASAVRTGPSHIIGSAAPSPTDLGFRMPAEFEPQTRVWVTTPTNPDTWPGCLDQAQDQHAEFCGLLAQVVDVRTTQSTGIAPEDAWVRDYGPIFVIDDEGNLAANHFRFNCWGEKYPPWDKMSATAAYVCDYVSHERKEPLPTWQHDMVLEGGSISVNGRGTLMTTEACLLHPNRNPALTRPQLEANLAATLGVSHFIWLPAGLEGDDTDGHIDDLAQFLDEQTIAYVAPQGGEGSGFGDPGSRRGSQPVDGSRHDSQSEPRSLNPEPLASNAAVLHAARNPQGQPFRLVALPEVHPPLYYEVDPKYRTQRILRDHPSGGGLVPASYANFLISNGHLFLPTFGRPTDDLAIAALEAVCPHLSTPLKIVPVRAEWLVVGLGALHCLSQQQPAVKDDWVRKSSGS